jgi:hypothetical protein
LQLPVIATKWKISVECYLVYESNLIKGSLRISSTHYYCDLNIA